MVDIDRLLPPEFPYIRLWFAFDRFVDKYHHTCPNDARGIIAWRANIRLAVPLSELSRSGKIDSGADTASGECFSRRHVRINLDPSLFLSAHNHSVSLSCLQRMKRDTSILQALYSRSVNGLKLGIHVHQHKGMEIHACWNIIPATGHYFRNCICRRIQSVKVFDVFLASIPRGGGRDWACVCFYGSCQCELRERAKPWHYNRGGGTKYIIWAGFNAYLKNGRLKCLCPETSCIEIGRHVRD